jgi:O-antigen ligase
LYPFRTFAPTLTVDFAHNDYLQILAELGLAGGGLAIALAIWIFWRPLSILAQPGSQQWALSLGLLGSLVAIGLHSFVDFNLYIPANAFALAWLAGVAVSPGLRER